MARMEQPHHRASMRDMLAMYDMFSACSTHGEHGRGGVRVARRESFAVNGGFHPPYAC